MRNVYQHFFNELVICPNTAHRVQVEQVTFQGISGRMAGVDVWWRCPSCNRWHILEIKPQTNEITRNEPATVLL